MLEALKFIFKYLIIVLFVSCNHSTKENKNKPTVEILKKNERSLHSENILFSKDKVIGDSLCKLAEKRNTEPVSNADLEEINNNFTFRGAYINPKLVFLFIQWLSDDKPPVLSVDIAAANVGTNQFFTDIAPYKTNSGYVVLEEKTDSVNATFQSYQWLGMLSNKVHVLRCLESSTDGSGEFITLLFVRFQIAKFNLNGKYYNQLLMNNISVHNIGDRVDNDIQLNKKANQIKLTYTNSEGKTISEIIKP
jgi:hypothetical protein